MTARKKLGEVLRFSVVGTIGFIVDASVLMLCYGVLRLEPLIARIPSFVIAVFCTWLLHRRWTFRPLVPRKASLAEFSAFLSTQLLGIIVNYSCFTLLILAFSRFENQPVLALAIASILTMAVNYVLARRIVFMSQNEQSAQSCRDYR